VTIAEAPLVASCLAALGGEGHEEATSALRAMAVRRLGNGGPEA